jgi:hypothetical protein
MKEKRRKNGCKRRKTDHEMKRERERDETGGRKASTRKEKTVRRAARMD